MCVQCGGRAPADTRIVVGIRGGPTPTDMVVCGRDCLAAWQQVKASRRRCIGFQCSRHFIPSEKGRPAAYHDEKCRKATDRALRRAQVLVARGRVPASARAVEEAIRLVTFLECCWSGKAAEVRHGRKFPTLDPPPPEEFRQATRAYLRTLHAALPERTYQEWVQQRNEQAAAAAREIDRIRRERQEKENAWRMAVLERFAEEAEEVAF